MRQFCETLESRQLLSASIGTINQDHAVLQANTQTLQSDLQTWAHSSADAANQLRIDFKKQPKHGSGPSPVTTYSDDVRAGFHKVNLDVFNLLTATIRDTNAIIADIKLILVKSTTALQTKLTAAIAKLKSDTSALQATTATDVQNLQTTISKDFTTMSSFSTLVSDAAKDKTTFTNQMNTVMTDLTALSNSTTKLATDAAK